MKYNVERLSPYHSLLLPPPGPGEKGGLSSPIHKTLDVALISHTPYATTLYYVKTQHTIFDLLLS
jgi:hypothetical protein